MGRASSTTGTDSKPWTSKESPRTRCAGRSTALSATHLSVPIQSEAVSRLLGGLLQIDGTGLGGWLSHLSEATSRGRGVVGRPPNESIESDDADPLGDESGPDQAQGSRTSASGCRPSGYHGASGRPGRARDSGPHASDSWDSRPNASGRWDVPHLRWERTSATHCCGSHHMAIRSPLTSIMFHYPSQCNDGCNLLGPDPVDLDDIRFVQFKCARFGLRCRSASCRGSGEQCGRRG